MEVTDEPVEGPPPHVRFETFKRNALHNRSLSRVSTDDLSPFITSIEAEQAQLVREEKYQDAQQLQLILEAAVCERERRQKAPIPALATADSGTVSHSLHDWDAKIEAFDAVTLQKLAALERHYNKKTELFEAEWRDDMPERYRKPSKRLLDMRANTLTLAGMKRFDEASRQKVQADALEQQEFQEAQRLLNADYAAAKKALHEKRALDRSTLVAKRAEQRDLLCARRKAVADSLLNRSLVMHAKTGGAGGPPTRRSLDGGTALLRRVVMAERPRIEGLKLPPLNPPNPRGR